ncbi:MAG: hypothetical protein IJW96_01105 [Clostridia bacterium]|nr:hypothetical protein [Clostridia bacterium]
MLINLLNTSGILDTWNAFITWFFNPFILRILGLGLSCFLAMILALFFPRLRKIGKVLTFLLFVAVCFVSSFDILTDVVEIPFDYLTIYVILLIIWGIPILNWLSFYRDVFKGAYGRKQKVVPPWIIRISKFILVGAIATLLVYVCKTQVPTFVNIPPLFVNIITFVVELSSLYLIKYIMLGRAERGLKELEKK